MNHSLSFPAALLVASVIICMSAVTAFAADANAGDGAAIPTVIAKPSAAEVARAEELVTTGYKAMQASNQDPSRSVEAALAFAEALPVFEAAEMHDRMRELNANIFWCRKRMNHDELRSYVKGKAGAGDVVARIEAVVNRSVPMAEADGWLQDADVFALNNPDQAMKISIRYFEVAERFAGSPASLSAQRKSLDYQARAGANSQQAKRDTLFTRPAEVATGRQPVPDPRAVSTAARDVKKLYRDGYSDRSDGGKHSLMTSLSQVASKSKDDPVTQYALFNEAMDLANDLKAVDAVLKLAEEEATFFAIDSVQLKKDQLGRMRTSAPAKAVITLLDNPADAAANTVAGKYYAMELRKWDLGFAMLSIGDDTQLAKLAEMEIAKPDGVQQELELADAWFALGGSKNAETVAAWDRAMRWYEKVQPNLEGATKARAKNRMEEMFGTVFPAKVDWDNLTADQWGKLKAVGGATVVANTPKTDTKVTLRAGQKARVVPHPTDTWYFNSYFSNGAQELTYKGREYVRSTFYINTGEDWSFPIGSLLMYVDDTKKAKAGVIEGPGTIILRSAQPQWGSKGQIRVKILLLD